ncbi:MAG: 4-(cytidine 5'-diphospho)-2-C-methyl-D-erythritol kinase [Spirochaetaceae bacterium]|jgi:4-diphosphocytidyl-2-C-methyl-D-erythritol kinase|nr:4-(cytidine 5'-diphospho)-2-C-methyl-D-erythritol kinase [Spirochaetaceae bacterium]
MDKLTINAPCKINLTLKVGDKRPDGFHNIESMFLALPLYDTLEFKFAPRADGAFSCAVTMKAEGLPPVQADALSAIPNEENIIYRAAALFHKETGVGFDLEAPVTKRIPAGGGLGGASTNAAAVLFALSKFTGQETAGLAALSGSDTPFLLAALENGGGGGIFGGAFCAFVSGRGERFIPIQCPVNPPFWVVLAHPGFSSGTPRAYALLDEFREKGEPGVEVSARLRTAPNSFLPVFLALGTEEERGGYAAILADLWRQKPDVYGLSGSGSVCFAVFTEESAAQKACAEIKAAWVVCV